MYILPTSVGVFYYNRHWRSIPPGRIGYPIYPARSNKCAGLYRQRVPCKLRVVRRLLARWPTTGCGKVDRLGRSTTQPCDLGAKSGYYTRAPPQTQRGADLGHYLAGARSVGYPRWFGFTTEKYLMLPGYGGVLQVELPIITYWG